MHFSLQQKRRISHALSDKTILLLTFTLSYAFFPFISVVKFSFSFHEKSDTINRSSLISFFLLNDEEEEDMKWKKKIIINKLKLSPKVFIRKQTRLGYIEFYWKLNLTTGLTAFWPSLSN